MYLSGSVSIIAMFGACSVARRGGARYTLEDGDIPILPGVDAPRVRAGPARVARLRLPLQPPRLHAAAVVRVPGRTRVAAAQLPQGRGVPRRRARLAGRDRPGPPSRPQHAVARVRVAAEEAPRRAGAGPAGRGRAGDAGAGPVGHEAADDRQHVLRAAAPQPPLRPRLPQDGPAAGAE